MGRQLTDANIEFISLVKKGANGERITIYKSANAEEEVPMKETTPGAVIKEDLGDQGTPENVVKDQDETEMKGFFQVLKDFFSPVAKSKDLPYPDYASFSSRIGNRRYKLSTALNMLESTFYEIFWNDRINNGSELILTNIEEFKVYVQGVLSQEETIKKDFFKKESEEEELELNKEDLQAVIKEALEPITTSITELSDKVGKIEKEDSEEVVKEDTTEEEVAKSGEEKKENKEEVVEKAEEITVDVIKALLDESVSKVATSVSELTDRVSVVEQARGISKSLESTEVKKDDDWQHGLLPFIPSN